MNRGHRVPGSASSPTVSKWLSARSDQHSPEQWHHVTTHLATPPGVHPPVLALMEPPITDARIRSSDHRRADKIGSRQSLSEAQSPISV